jgi:hypothetical protein
MTTNESIFFRTGAFGRESLEVTPVNLFESNEPGIKIRVCYPHRNHETGLVIERHTDTFLNNEQVERLMDILDGNLDCPIANKHSISCGKKELDEVSIEPHTIQEKTNVINSLKITIKVPGNDDKNYYFAITSLNKATQKLFADYLYDWLIEKKFIEEEESASPAIVQ